MERKAKVLGSSSGNVTDLGVNGNLEGASEDCGNGRFTGFDALPISRLDFDAEIFNKVVAQSIVGLDAEVAELKTEAVRLKKEIGELCGEDDAVIGD